MKALIPAAGLGTRFLPVTRVVPKEMLPIGSRPALELLVEEARAAGADGITVIISHAKELIREYFRGQSDIRFVYQEEQRGLGHAVLQAKVDDDVLILLGDALVTGCVAAAEMAKLARAHGGAGVIGLEHVPADRVSRYGIVKMEGDRIVDMVEKPRPEDAPSDLAVAGRYLLPRAIFGLLETQTPGVGGEIQLTDAIRRLIAADGGARPVLGYVYPGRRHDIGNPDGYFAALTAFREET